MKKIKKALIELAAMVVIVIIVFGTLFVIAKAAADVGAMFQ